MTHSVLRIMIVTAIWSLTALTARAGSEIVVAIRYLQAEGTSHSHLYLYREDGKLIRQLTNDRSGQDATPIFAPDGASIIFTREEPGGAAGFWSIDPRAAGLRKLDAAPDWYSDAKNSPYFTNIEPEQSPSPSPEGSSAETSPPSYNSSDGSFELILREDPNDENDQIDGPGHGKHYLLRNLKTGTETDFERIPGFYGVFGLLHDSKDIDHHFLFDGPLRLAFFDLHLNSTDGDTVFALDLTGPRLVRLSPNWAMPIPLPGEAAFLTFTENLYVPIAGSKKTANCSYMEHWDEKLNKVRYAREKSAALCYGASMYRPGKDPAVITLRHAGPNNSP
ncbi:MAG TPA: hypothetical protein VFQ83_02455 [Candidatus Udaeobacter sp.]|nr:hypothetical protein [Candidatus Udaeobacter sp.]